MITPVFKSPIFDTVNSILILSFNATLRIVFVGVTFREETFSLCEMVSF